MLFGNPEKVQHGDVPVGAFPLPRKKGERKRERIKELFNDAMMVPHLFVTRIRWMPKNEGFTSPRPNNFQTQEMAWMVALHPLPCRSRWPAHCCGRGGLGDVGTRPLFLRFGAKIVWSDPWLYSTGVRFLSALISPGSWPLQGEVSSLSTTFTS